MRSNTAMKCAALVYTVVLLCHVAMCWRYTESADDKSEDRSLIDLLRAAKRANWIDQLCGKWDEWCQPNTDKVGLACCSRYTCKCNLWNTNCRCRSKLFGK